MNKETTLKTLARGLIAQEKEGKLSYPYPDDLQKALNKLALAGITKQVEYPQNVMEVISWSKRPLRTWFPDDLPEEITASDTLLDGDGKTTELCHKLTE